MKQINLFGEDFEKKTETQYTSKIVTPIYEPKNKKPNLIELVNNQKTKRLINEINSSNISENDKYFLIESANRHTVFNYQLIADYYAHSSSEVQKLMEKQCLVIVDFEKAYENGYIKLAHEIANQYFNNYG